MRRTGHGFTLPEMLTVLAIMGVLAGIVFPVVGSVREKGRQAACQSNLRQVFMAMQQYVQDYDSRLPSYVNWREATKNYIKSPQVFRCPSLPEQIQRPDGIMETAEYNFYVGFLNSFVMEHFGSHSRPGPVGVSESVLDDAARIFVSGDVGVHGFSRQVTMPRPDACGITTGSGRPDNLQTVSTVHNGGGNYLFYDGHVKWMTPETFAQSLCDAAKYLQPPFRADGPHIP